MCDVCTLFVLWVWYETENTSTITLWWHPLFLLLNPYFFEFISELPIQFSRPDSLIIYIIKIDLARHTYMHMCVWFIYKINLLWKNTWSTAGMLYVCSIQFGRWYITQEVLWPVIRLPSLLTSTTVPSNEQDVQEILVQILLFFSFPFSLCCTSVGLKCALQQEFCSMLWDLVWVPIAKGWGFWEDQEMQPVIFHLWLKYPVTLPWCMSRKEELSSCQQLGANPAGALFFKMSTYFWCFVDSWVFLNLFKALLSFVSTWASYKYNRWVCGTGAMYIFDSSTFQNTKNAEVHLHQCTEHG